MIALTHKAEVLDYVNGVIAGDIVAGRFVVMACQRYLKDIEQAESKGWFFDEERACTVIDFIQTLKHTKGRWAKKRFMLSPSQKFIVWNLFGWKILEDCYCNGNEPSCRDCKGTGQTKFRRFRSAYITVSRKWGKSTFVCAIALALLFIDDPIEVEAEGYVAATKEKQAQRITSQAWKMIQQNESLKSRAKHFEYLGETKTIILPGEPYNGSVFSALGSDKRTADGLNISFAIMDELHEWRDYHAELKEKLETGSGSRTQPLCFIITTAGSDQSKIWEDHDNLCVKVIESAVHGDCQNEEMFIFMPRLDEKRPCDCGGEDKACGHCKGTGEIPGDDVFDEKLWRKANPDIGVTPDWKTIRDIANKAKFSPDSKRTLTRFHMNSKVRSALKIINPNVWARATGELSDWTGQSVFGAWDIGTVDDLSSIALCSNIDDNYELRSVSFCPSEGKRDLTKTPWSTWIELGLLIPTDGDVTDFKTIQNKIIELDELYNVEQWAFDPKHSTQLSQELYNDEGVVCAGFKQHYSEYTEPIESFLRLLAKGEIVHDGNALLSWAAGNLITKQHGSLKMPDKERASEKIDPMVAVLMAFARCSLSVEAGYSGPLFLG